MTAVRSADGYAGEYRCMFNITEGIPCHFAAAYRLPSGSLACEVCVARNGGGTLMTGVRELCGFPARHLGRPCSVYECPNGHGRFTHYTYNGAVCWCCPDCGDAGRPASLTADVVCDCRPDATSHHCGAR